MGRHLLAMGAPFTEIPVDRDLTHAERDWVAENLHDREWRLNHLYHVRHDGQLVTFRMRPSQRDLLGDPHPRLLALKVRGEGMSTGVQIDFLDSCMFQPNMNVASIAGRAEDGERLFRDKVRLAYDFLPSFIKEMNPLVRSEDGDFRWENESTYFTSTRTRSQRPNRLHISEFGPLCAESPRKAQEVVDGSIQSISRTGQIIIESTAMGVEGYFHRYCMDAIDIASRGIPLTRLDWKLWFWPWFAHNDYELSEEEAANVLVPEHLQAYFLRLHHDIGARLSITRKAWYVKKLAEMSENAGDDTGSGWSRLKAEYPSYPREAFDVAIAGTYYAEQFDRIFREKRIGKVTYEPGYPVDTWWDIGVNDPTIIWFTQDVGREIRVINYSEEHDRTGLDGAIDKLESLKQKDGYRYGRHYAPHDIKVTEWTSSGRSRLEIAKTFGYHFQPNITKPANGREVEEQIESTRRVLALCVFDEEKCREGVIHLRNYRRAWDEKRGWLGRPDHGGKAGHSHAADAFRLIGAYHSFYRASDDYRIALPNYAELMVV